jgi:hypothetical protein
MRTLYRRHHAFVLLFLLFVSFRLLAILLFRPGGFITDFSDLDFYYTWGTLVPMGYHAYDNLWTAYPPLFPAVMLTVFEASSRIPPWVEPRLAFHVLFGLTLLIFESGNFVLIYRLGNRLGWAAMPLGAEPARTPFPPGLVPCVLYALFFVPVYTLIGWFEPMPLFFMLLSLDLLLVDSMWGWGGSAVAAGLGFLTKLTPVLLVPIAVRWLGVKLSWRAVREEWFSRASGGNIARAVAYVAIFFAVVVGVGYPFVRANPSLAFSSFRIQSIRPPWQSVWAVIDGFYGYGLVPLDMRNLNGLAGPLWETSLPWTWIGLAFVAVYLWLYTRRYDWANPRTPVAFSAVSVLLLFLYSKGWSPQFLLWVLVYIALLLPTLRGVTLAVVLSLINFVEADVFLIILPEEHWIMVGTVVARTLLLILLMLEFLAQIWPNERRGVVLRKFSAYASWAIIAVSIVAAIVAAPRAAQAYADRRLAEHPCPGAVEYLREQAQWPSSTIVSQQSEVWRDLYPWLRNEYEIHVLDGYANEQTPESMVLQNLENVLATRDTREFWWIERTDIPPSPTSPLSARTEFLDRQDTEVVDENRFGACTLTLVAQLDPQRPTAVAEVAGGPLDLLDIEVGTAHMGDRLPLVLYWLGRTPIADSYTVFVQLLDANGDIVAQQDNLPVQGLAPTNTWQSGVVIRDPYLLDLGTVKQPGSYDLAIGLYDEEGKRVTLTDESGTTADFYSYPVVIDGN